MFMKQNKMKEIFKFVKSIIPKEESLLKDGCYQGADMKGQKKYTEGRLQYNDGWNNCIKNMLEEIERRKEFYQLNPGEIKKIKK